MSFIDKLRRKPKNKKPAIVFYSKHGLGKTSLASRFKKPVFLIHPKEDGIGDLQQSGLAETNIPVFTATCWEEADECVDALLNGEFNECETLVIDELGGFEEMLHEYVGKVEFGGDMTETGFFSFQNGPNKIAPMYFAKFLSKLERLRDEKGMLVIVLSHSKIKTFTDPQRPQYDRIILSCGDKTAAAVLEWATTIGFIDTVIEMASLDGKNGKKRARGGDERVLHLSQSAVFEAKNRWGITEPVSLGSNADEGFDNFNKAVSDAIKSNKNKGTAE